MSATRIPKSPMPDGFRGRPPSPPPSPRPRGNGILGGPLGPPVVGSDGLSGASIGAVPVFSADGIRGTLDGQVAGEKPFPFYVLKGVSYSFRILMEPLLVE